MKFSNSTFDFLKWLCLIVLPALSTAVSIIFKIWGIPLGDEIAQTITAVAALIGACLGVSSVNYYKNDSIERPDDEVIDDHKGEIG